MSQKNKKQFGVWMDTHNAIIIGKEDFESDSFKIINHVKNNGASGNSNENASNNQEIALTQKFFKEIAINMPNIDQIHVTGTGQIQEQFIKFLAETAQYKNVDSSESTSTKMSDAETISYFEKYFK